MSYNQYQQAQQSSRSQQQPGASIPGAAASHQPTAGAQQQPPALPQPSMGSSLPYYSHYPSGLSPYPMYYASPGPIQSPSAYLSSLSPLPPQQPYGVSGASSQMQLASHGSVQNNGGAVYGESRLDAAPVAVKSEEMSPAVASSSSKSSRAAISRHNSESQISPQHAPSEKGSADGDDASKKSRKVSRLACINCRKSHSACDETRPCQRCREHDLECVDVQGKKRGRKRKEDKAAEEARAAAMAGGADEEEAQAAAAAAQAAASTKSARSRKRAKTSTQQDHTSPISPSASEVSSSAQYAALQDQQSQQVRAMEQFAASFGQSRVPQQQLSDGQSDNSQEALQRQLQKQLELLQQLNMITPQIPNELKSILIATPDQWFVNNSSLKSSVMSMGNTMFDTGYGLGAAASGGASLAAASASQDAFGAALGQQLYGAGQQQQQQAPLFGGAGGMGQTANPLGLQLNDADISNFFMSSLIDTRGAKPLLDGDTGLDFNFDLEEFARSISPVGPQTSIPTASGASGPVFSDLDNVAPSELLSSVATSVAPDVTMTDGTAAQVVPQPKLAQEFSAPAVTAVPSVSTASEPKEEISHRETASVEAAPAASAVPKAEKQLGSGKGDLSGLISSDISKIVEESIVICSDTDDKEKKADYMEYLKESVNIPTELIMQRRERGTNSSTVTPSDESATSAAVIQGQPTLEQFQALQKEVAKLKDQLFKKTNEVNFLSALNEHLRSRLVDTLTAVKRQPASAQDRTIDTSAMVSKQGQRVRPSTPISTATPATPRRASSPVPQPPARRSELKEDVTALQHAYQELFSLMKNEKEMDTSQFGIMLCFPGGRIVSVNKKLLTVLGYAQDDVFYQLNRWEDVVAPSSYSGIVQGILTCMKQPPSARKSFRLPQVECKRKDGSLVQGEVCTCIVGSKNTNIPIFAISYFAFRE